MFKQGEFENFTLNFKIYLDNIIGIHATQQIRLAEAKMCFVPQIQNLQTWENGLWT